MRFRRCGRLAVRDAFINYALPTGSVNTGNVANKVVDVILIGVQFRARIKELPCCVIPVICLVVICV